MGPKTALRYKELFSCLLLFSAMCPGTYMSLREEHSTFGISWTSGKALIFSPFLFVELISEDVSLPLLGLMSV